MADEVQNPNAQTDSIVSAANDSTAASAGAQTAALATQGNVDAGPAAAVTAPSTASPQPTETILPAPGTAEHETLRQKLDAYLKEIGGAIKVDGAEFLAWFKKHA